MMKNTEKANISITKIILITFLSIMLVSGLVNGAIIFKNWFAYADRALTEAINRFDRDVYNVVDLYVKNHWSTNEGEEDLSNYVSMIANEEGTIAIVVDRSTGNLIANSMKIDNYLIFQDGSKKPVRIYDIGYPALISAYESFLNSNIRSFKLKNIESKLYIKVSEYKTEDLDWLILSAISEANLTSAVRLNIIYTMSISILAFALAIIVYYVITNKLLMPISYLIAAKEAFTRGDLSQRAIVVRNDEIGMIARAFNNMADTICELIYNLEYMVKERTLELEEAHRMMRESRNQLRLILDSTAEAIYGMDIEGNCTFCNRRSLELLGYSQYDELIGKNMHYQIHHSNRDGTPMDISECKIIKAIKEGTCYHAYDEIFWRKDGSFFDVEYNVYPQLKDEIVGAVVTFTDITESKKVKEHIEYLSTHDPVTGAYNRRFFEDELKRIDKEENLPISIIYGDVNGLKLLNDIHGHAKGDELLIRTTEVLTRVCRENDIVARVGGDEFVILLAKTEAKEANILLQRIKSELASEEIAGIKASISLAADTKTSPEDDIYAILNNAEAAMYKVKTLERKNVSSGMLKGIMEALYRRSQREKIHSINVSRLSKRIAIQMNLPENDIKKVAVAGFYHDIGKIVLDKDTLNKQEELKEKEMEEMERHPLIGYRILNLFDETVDIAEAVLTHHERWDGTGYPKGLKGEEIHIFARIISVAEGYDAMTNALGGKGLTHEEAIEEIKTLSGIKYDPEVVAYFTSSFNNYKIS